MAGGWFFLMACEMFVLGNRDLRLPGLGSYLQTAANAGDTRAIAWGLAVMIGVIVLIDQTRMAPGDSVGRTVQVRAGGGGGSTALSDSGLAAALAVANGSWTPDCRAGARETEPALRAEARFCFEGLRAKSSRGVDGAHAFRCGIDWRGVRDGKDRDHARGSFTA